MDVTEDVTCTLRAEAHHPPCVMESAGFCTEHSAQARFIGYEEERSPTLRAGVIPAAIALENHPTDSRIKFSEDGTMQTLTSRMGTGGNNVPLLMKIRSGCEGGGKGPLIQEEKDYYEKLERTYLTIWLEDQPNDSGLEDYCNRHLSGLMTDYYGLRWSLYKEALIDAMDNGYTVQQFKTIEQPKLDTAINEQVVAWTNDHTPYPTEPVGDTIEISHDLIIKYADIFKEVYNYDVDPSLLEKGTDKSELTARYSELKDTENVYTVNSYKAFAAALETAKSVIDNTEATQDDVNSALAQLNSAFENLSYNKGDVNHDGKLTITDATLIQIYISNKLAGTQFDTETADADGNDDINVDDVTIIQKTLVEMYHIDDDGNIV